MKQFTRLLAVIALVCALATFFVGCETTGHTHEYGEWTVVTQPTCGEKGLREKVCSACGEKVQDELPATGEHDYEVKSTTASDCKTAGTETLVCKVCGNQSVRNLPLSDEHAYVWTITTEPTCSEEGVSTGTCSVCGDVTTKTIPVNPDNHAGNFGKWTTESEATCQSEGKRYRFCIDCGEKIEEVIPVDPNAHSAGELVETVVSTCSRRGHKTYKCEFCQQNYDVELPLDSSNHVYGASTQTKAPTCTEEGTLSRTCDGCGHVDNSVVPVDIYAHGESFTTVGNFRMCNDCKGLLDEQKDIVNAGKYEQMYEVYLAGGFEIEFDFFNRCGDDAWWHNFIFDVAPAYYLNGKLQTVKNGIDPLTPIIPGWSQNYVTTDHPFFRALDEGQSMTTSWFLDEIEDTSFEYCMRKGVDVKATFKREGTGAVQVSVVMTTTNDSGLLRTCTLSATLGYKGAEMIFVTLTGEKNTVNLKQVKVINGTLCATDKTESGETVLGGAVVDNGTVKNVYGRNLLVGEGDFDMELDFDIASHNPTQIWHNFLIYVFQGKDADVTKLSREGKHWMSMAGIGLEPDNWAIYHDFADRSVTATEPLENTIGNANFKVRLSRHDGYITMFATATKDGKVVATYRYFSSINSADEYLNHGFYNGELLIRLTTENAQMTINSVKVYGGDVTAPHTHTYGDWQTTKEANCKETGTAVRKCTTCGEEESKILDKDPDNHADYGLVDDDSQNVAGTCVKKGQKASVCKGCGEAFMKDTDYDMYNHAGTFTTVDGYKICNDCKGLLSEQKDIVNAGKYQNYYELYLDGGFDVEFTFRNVAGSGSAEWHNFIFDVAPLTYVDGKLTCIKNGDNPITPIIPYWFADYYSAAQHPFLTVLDGSENVSTTWFGNGADFATCMRKGVDVTARFTRTGTGVVNVNIVMTTTDDNGETVSCTITAKLGYKGVKGLYITLTSEGNTVNLKQVKVLEGTICGGTIVEEGTKIVENVVVDNADGTKNVQGSNIAFGEGDFDIMLDFDIASYNPTQVWHNYLVYLFKDSDADTSQLYAGGKLYMGMAGNGWEPNDNAICHGISGWSVQAASGVNLSDVIGNATFKLRITRRSGYITMFGNAIKDGNVVAQYRFFSSINSDNEWYNHGNFDGAGIIRLTTENAKMTINSVTVYGGDVTAM